MEGENNNMNSGVNYSAGENKSNSLLWSIIAIVIVVALGYLLFVGKDDENIMNNNTDGTNQAYDDNMGTQSDSSDVNAIESDMEATNFNSLEVEIE